MTMRGWTAAPTSAFSAQVEANAQAKAEACMGGPVTRIQTLPQVRKRVLPGGGFVAKEE